MIPDAWSVQALTEQIDHHLARPDSAKQQMSSTCWDIASKLRVEDNARQVVEVFEEVVREKNAA